MSKLSTDFSAIHTLIVDAKHKASFQVNKILIELYWRIGQYVSEKVTQEGWGKSVVDERFEKQISEVDTLKQQYELRLKHLLDEKHQAIEKVDQLQSEISQHQQSLLDQAKKYQAMREKEQELQELQEDSEKRWVQLIDQARSEAKICRKNTKRQCANKMIKSNHYKII